MANVYDYRASSEDASGETYNPAQSLEARYDGMCPDREPYLKRARDASKLTIPSLIPPQGHAPGSELYKPWQSIGARGVNNLGAKLVLTLLPPNNPFVRFLVSQVQLDKLNGDPALMSNLEEALGKYEKEILMEVETGTTRATAFETLLHLIVAGNGCTYMPTKGGMKLYHLDSYVCQRDPMGNVIEIITEERLAIQAVPDEIKSLVMGRTKDSKEVERTIRLHTCIKREGNKFISYQELKGIEVPGSRGSYPLDASPWNALRWTKIDGENYGRGHVEMCQGDLQSVEGLTQSIVEGSAAAAKVLFLAKPNGVTKMKTIAEAPNGAVRAGNAEDVTVVRVEKHNDFRVALDTIDRLESRLQAIFLMNSSVTRNAERVTAEEIRFMAQELESALGGVYSLLGQEFQLPLANRIMAQLVKQKRLDPLPKGIVKPTIVTGLEALSRGADLQRLDIFMQGAELMGPGVVDKYVNLSDYFTRRATALGISQKGLIKSADQVAQAEQAAQQQNMMSQVGPIAAKSIGDIAKERLKNASPQGQPAPTGAPA